MKRMSTLDMTYIALFAILIGICSFITIPGAVPFTLQTFGVFLTVIVLGGKRGTAAVLLYIFIGLTGIPVFSGFRGGISVFFGNTGGYILGFILSALLIWLLELFFGKKLGVQIISLFLGQLLCYVFGTIWFLLLYAKNNAAISFGTVLSWCVIPFLIPDCIKIFMALVVGRQLRKILAKISTR